MMWDVMMMVLPELFFTWTVTLEENGIGILSVPPTVPEPAFETVIHRLKLAGWVSA
jgi:hypothetical protein